MKLNNYNSNEIFGKFSKQDNTEIFNNSNFMASFITKTLRWNKNYVLSFVDNHIIHYPTPINLSYAWSFGITSAACLVIQILSGIFLAMHYTPHIDLAFSSVEHIMRDVNNGWLLRYMQYICICSEDFIMVHICNLDNYFGAQVLLFYYYLWQQLL